MGLGLTSYRITDETKLTTAVEFEKTENMDFLTHLGTELVYNNLYSLRMGYIKSDFTFGAGLKYDRLKIDYAFRTHDYLDNTHRFSLSFLIGASSEEKLSRMAEQERQQGSDIIEDERKRQFDFYNEKAEHFYSVLQLDSALAYFHRALAFDESNETIIGTIASLEKSIISEKVAEENLERTRNEYKRLVKSHYTQAESFYSKKYYLAALDMLDLIFDIDPSNLKANVLKQSISGALQNEINQKLAEGEKAENDGNIQLAISSYSRVLELDSDNKVVKTAIERISSQIDIAQQLNKAIEFYNKGNLARARSDFNIVLSVDKNNPVAIEYLRKITSSKDIKTTSLEDLQKDKQIWQLYLDGLKLMRNKEYQKAIDVWNKVLDAYPNNISTIDNIEQARLRLDSEQ
jgi:tetratricopeptide (TPR) repeat protein